MERCKFEVTDEVRRSNPLPAALRPLKERRTSGLQGIGRLEQLRSLQKIELAYCSGLTDVFVATICHISSIVTLNLLKSDLITQAGLAVITTLRMLRSLDLTACNDVSDIIFLCLCRLTRLEKLSLAYCSGWSEAGLESLAEIPSITDLDLAYSYPLQNRSLVALTQGLTALTSLDISGGNLLTDEGFQSLGRSHNLKRLGLEGCTGLTGGGLYAVAGLPSLSYLNLQECQGLSPEELRLLTSLHGLRELHLLDCPGVTNELLDSLEAHLPFLSTLTAS